MFEECHIDLAMNIDVFHVIPAFDASAVGLFAFLRLATPCAWSGLTPFQELSWSASTRSP